jgi:hypothetical protein
MERARATWTDERLDDLSRRIEAGFDRLDGDLRQLRTEMTTEMTGLRGEMTSVRSDMSTRFDALQRLLIQLFGAMFIGVIGIVATVLATA